MARRKEGNKLICIYYHTGHSVNQYVAYVRTISPAEVIQGNAGLSPQWDQLQLACGDLVVLSGTFTWDRTGPRTYAQHLKLSHRLPSRSPPRSQISILD